MRSLFISLLLLSFVASRAYGLYNATTINLPTEFAKFQTKMFFSSSNDPSNLFVLASPVDSNYESYIFQMNVETGDVLNYAPFSFNLEGVQVCGFYAPSETVLVIAITNYNVGSNVIVLDAKNLLEKNECSFKSSYNFCELSDYDPGVLVGNDLYFVIYPESPDATSFLHFPLSSCKVDKTLYTITGNGTIPYQFVYGYVESDQNVVAYLFQNKTGVLAEMQIDASSHEFSFVKSEDAQYFGVVGMAPLPSSITPPSFMYIDQNPSPGSVTIYTVQPFQQNNTYTFSIPNSFQIAQGLLMAEESFFIVTSAMGDGNGYLNQFSLNGTFQENIVNDATTQFVIVGNYIFFATGPTTIMRYNID